MVLANTATGGTEAFDLSDKGQFGALLRLIRSGTVRALSIHHRGMQHVLTPPRRFRKVTYGAEPIFNGNPAQAAGERIYCQADGVRVSLTSTFAGPLVRCDVERTGSQRYDPLVK